MRILQGVEYKAMQDIQRTTPNRAAFRGYEMTLAAGRLMPSQRRTRGLQRQMQQTMPVWHAARRCHHFRRSPYGVHTNDDFSLTRVYNPRTGTWLTQDPMGYVDGASLYQAMSDSPINRTDPRGQADLVMQRTEGELAHTATIVVWFEFEYKGKPDREDVGGKVEVYKDATIKAANGDLRVAGLTLEFHPKTADSCASYKWVQFFYSYRLDKNGKRMPGSYDSDSGVTRHWSGETNEWYVDTNSSLTLQRTLSFTNVTQTPLRTSVSTSFLQPVFGGSPLESASTL